MRTSNPTIHLDDDDQIEVTYLPSTGVHVIELYSIGHRSQRVEIHCNRDRLERLVAAGAAYLAVHPERPMTAEDMESVTDADMTWVFEHVLLRPVPAEAATDAPCSSPRCSLRVDTDELLATMASSFEPRRDVP